MEVDHNSWVPGSLAAAVATTVTRRCGKKPAVGVKISLEILWCEENIYTYLYHNEVILWYDEVIFSSHHKFQYTYDLNYIISIIPHHTTSTYGFSWIFMSLTYWVYQW